MAVFQANEYYFIKMGILAPKPSRFMLLVSLFRIFKNIFFAASLGIFMCSGSATYIYYNSDDLENSINAIIFLSGGFMCVMKYIFLRINAEKLAVLLESFRKIVENGL